ncbi:MAG: UbiH/UbiF/VisC/COQ6 family ubiquinone biosynthesis hydroxylase [Bermanella sp.]
MTFDMVIIGGGMVGTAVACALKDSGLKVALVEPNMPQAPSNLPVSVSDVDMRVSALNRASESFLNNIGAWPKMPDARLSPYDKMRIWDGVGTGHIQFDAIELGETHLGHIVENRVTAQALMMQLQQSQNVQLLAGETVKEIEEIEDEKNRFLVHLDSGQMLMTPLIVAADGARSFVRNWAEFEMREWDYNHNGLVCSVQTEEAHQQCAWQRFTESGVLAFLPLPQENLCSIVWSCPEQQAQLLLALDEDEFNVELSKAFENKLGKVVASGQRVAIPLRQRHAKSYVKEGIVLVGDAAHTIHPLAGQGVNLGLMDAYVLADEIKQGLSRGLQAHDSQLLARYERRRMPENLSMMTAMESFKRLFAVQSPVLRWARNWGMSKLNKIGFLKQHLAAEAMGIGRKLR